MRTYMVGGIVLAMGLWAVAAEAKPAWTDLVATNDRNVVLLGTGEPARLRVRAVTDGYCRVFGLQPAPGRDLLVEE
jgi:hypothetical protein